MPDRDQVFTVVAEWVTKADNDLKTAAHTLELREDCPADTVCFHAQQCVEKYIKALLVQKGIDFPRTHDLERLASLLPPGARPGLSPDQRARLADYATGARYPGWGDISLAEARRAVALARRVRKEVRRMLPTEALPRTRL